jgi:hypothetical protein
LGGKSFILLFDAIIDNNVITEFKIAIINRLGGKKGDFSKALEEAMELWIKSEETNRLAERAVQKGISMSERNNIINTLFTYRKVAIPAYMKIIESKEVLDAQKQLIYNNIQKINQT